MPTDLEGKRQRIVNFGSSYGSAGHSSKNSVHITRLGLTKLLCGQHCYYPISQKGKLRWRVLPKITQAGRYPDCRAHLCLIKSVTFLETH